MDEMEQMKRALTETTAKLDAAERRRQDAIARPAIQSALKKAGLSLEAIKIATHELMQRVEVDGDDSVRMRDDFRDLQNSIWSWLRGDGAWIAARDREIAEEKATTATTAAPPTLEDRKRQLGAMVAGLPGQKIESREALEIAVGHAFGAKAAPEPSGEPTLREKIGRGLVEAL